MNLTELHRYTDMLVICINDVPCSTTPNVPLKDIVRLEHNDISIVIVIQTAN